MWVVSGLLGLPFIVPAIGGGLSGFCEDVVFAPHSRENEREADKVCVCVYLALSFSLFLSFFLSLSLSLMGSSACTWPAKHATIPAPLLM